MMTTKKEIFQYLFNALEPMIPVPILKKNKKVDTITFDSTSGNKIIFSLLPVLGGRKGKGSFVLTYSMALYNPTLSHVLKRPFHVEEGPDPGLLLALSSNNNLPKDLEPDLKYSFCVEADNKETADQLLDDIRQYFMPYVNPILSEYDLLLDNYADPLFVKNLGKWSQFRLGVCAALLTNREDAIKEFLVPLAESNTNKLDFMDFKKATDYQTELVDPIKKYAVDNNLIES